MQISIEIKTIQRIKYTVYTQHTYIRSRSATHARKQYNNKHITSTYFTLTHSRHKATTVLRSTPSPPRCTAILRRATNVASLGGAPLSSHTSGTTWVTSAMFGSSRTQRSREVCTIYWSILTEAVCLRYLRFVFIAYCSMSLLLSFQRGRFKDSQANVSEGAWGFTLA